MKIPIMRLLFATTVWLFLFSGSLLAQNPDTDYLAGAVPVQDGKVVFRESFSVPNVSRDSIMSMTRDWINGRNNEAEQRLSRVLIYDEENGNVIGGCTEKLVFKSALLVLDQADMSYYLNVTCNPGTVDMEIIRIRYDYGIDGRFTAEEMITDEVGLNKDRTKMLRFSRKWRIKTIDFARDLFKDYKLFLFNHQF